MSELAFQRQVDDLARMLGWKKLALDVVQKKRATGTSRGWPDRVYFRKGRIVVLEMKAEKGGRVSPEQETWIDEWVQVAMGATSGQIRVAVVRPSELPTIATWLG